MKASDKNTGPSFGSGQFFDDIARMTSGAMGAFSGFKDHMEAEVKACVTRFAREMDFVPREEFEIVEAMAKKAREENDALAKRLDALEKSMGGKKSTSKAKNSKTKPKTKSKK